MGTINIEQAIFGTNEGRRDFEALSKKLEPKQNELKGQNDNGQGVVAALGPAVRHHVPQPGGQVFFGAGAGSVPGAAGRHARAANWA